MANRATGVVERIYARAEQVNIRLAIPAAQRPADGYFALLQSHPNYQALYALALSAAINRYPLLIRATGEIVSTETATVEYLVVDW